MCLFEPINLAQEARQSKPPLMHCADWAYNIIPAVTVMGRTELGSQRNWAIIRSTNPRFPDHIAHGGPATVPKDIVRHFANFYSICALSEKFLLYIILQSTHCVLVDLHKARYREELQQA